MRLAGFGSLPLIASLSPLLVLGIVARVCTPAEWAALGVGQAVGSFATVAVTFGWTVLGPPSLATTRDEGARRDLYAVSWWTRVLVGCLAVPSSAALASILVSPETALLAGCMCSSTALAGLTMAWYAVGLGRPSLAAIFDVIPRLAALGAGASLVWVTGEPLWLPLCAGVGVGVALLAFHRWMHRRFMPPWPGGAALVEGVRASASSAAVMSVGSLYTSAPVPVATLVAGAHAVAGLSSADRLYRYSLFVVGAVADALQAWVLERGIGGRRQTAAVLLHIALGLTGAVGLLALGQGVTAILFGASLAAPGDVLWGYALAFAFVCVSTPFVRNVLVPAGATNGVLIANLAGLVAGVGSLAPAVSWAGVAGVPLAFAATEGTTMAVVIVRSVFVLRLRRDGQDAERR